MKALSHNVEDPVCDDPCSSLCNPGNNQTNKPSKKKENLLGRGNNGRGNALLRTTTDLIMSVCATWSSSLDAKELSPKNYNSQILLLPLRCSASLKTKLCTTANTLML